MRWEMNQRNNVTRGMSKGHLYGLTNSIYKSAAPVCKNNSQQSEMSVTLYIEWLTEATHTHTTRSCREFLQRFFFSLLYFINVVWAQSEYSDRWLTSGDDMFAAWIMHVARHVRVWKREKNMSIYRSIGWKVLLSKKCVMIFYLFKFIFCRIIYWYSSLIRYQFQALRLSHPVRSAIGQSQLPIAGLNSVPGAQSLT